MKICLITDTYNPYFDGGAGIYVEALAREISEVGHHVSVVTTTEFRGLDSLDFEEEVVSSHLSVFRFYPLNLYHKAAYRKHSFVIKPFWYAIDIWNPHSYKAYLRLAHRMQWNIVHTHNVGSLSFSIFSAIRKLKLPWIHTFHDYAFLCPRATLYRSSEKICRNSPWPCRLFRLSKKGFWGNPDLVLGPSKFILDIFSEHGFIDNCKKGVLPLGIPSNSQHLKAMSHYRHQKAVHANGKLKVLFLGRIDLFKGAEWLLRAFTAASVRGIELHFAGTGPQAARLRERYRGLQVVFHGYVQDAHKDALLKASDALIIPSLWYENSPVAVYEALTYGMPVLGSRIGGIPELVRDGETGYLFEPGNDQDLITAIRTLASNRDQLKIMSQRCLQVANDLRLQVHLDRLLSSYHDCLDANGYQSARSVPGNTKR